METYVKQSSLVTDLLFHVSPLPYPPCLPPTPIWVLILQQGESLKKRKKEKTLLSLSIYSNGYTKAFLILCSFFPLKNKSNPPWIYKVS